MKARIVIVSVASLLGCKDSDRNQTAVSAHTIAHWKLADSARLAIGGKGDSATFRYVTGARLYPGAHELLVLDPYQFQVLFFDSRTGTLRRKLGRNGSGPREFQHMTGLAIFGDTLRVVDRSTTRLTSWVRGEENPTVRVVERVKVDSGYPEYHLPLAGSNVLFDVSSTSRLNGQRVDSASYLIVDASGGVHQAGRFESGDNFYECARGCMIDNAPFSAPTMVKSASDGGFWVAETDQGKLYRISTDGATRTLVDLPIVRGKVTDADKTTFSEWYVNLFPDQKVKAERTARLKEMTFPSLLPGFSGWGGMASSCDGGVWVAAYAQAAALTRKWYVVSAAGLLRATIDLPRELDVIDAGDDYMVAQGKDPDGNPVVVLYDITH